MPAAAADQPRNGAGRVHRSRWSRCHRARIPDIGCVVRERQNVLVQIEFSAEQAWIGLAPGEWIARGPLLACLTRARVVFGHLPEGFAAAAIPAAKARRIVIARGLPTISGSPATLEYMLDPFLLPRLEAFDAFDFAAMVRSRLVRAGDPLVCVLPATPGQAGMDVHGRSQQPAAVRDIDIGRFGGQGTRLCEKDALTVEAATAGIAHRDASGCMRVLQLMEMRDVDRVRGDIDSPLPLLIHGDIGDGLRVKSAGDIIVLGSVGDSRVSARGNLLVRDEIRPGSQRVKAHGDLLAARMVSRRIKANRVAVLGQARDCEVLATGTVSIQEVIGGSIVAANGLRCEHLGTGADQAARIEVGRDPLLEHRANEARSSLPALGRRTAELRLRCNQVARDMDAYALDDSYDARALELRGLIESYRQELKRLTEARAVINLTQSGPQRTGHRIPAAIEVTGTARPGVTVVLGSCQETLVAPVRHPCFRLHGGRIAW